MPSHRSKRQSGYPEAQAAIGWKYQNGIDVNQDIDKAVQWTRKSVEQGSPSGYSNLAWMYEKGIGVKQDTSKAAEWYRKANEQGSEFAAEGLKRVSGQSGGMLARLFGR